MDELLRTTLSAARDEVEASVDVDRAWRDLTGRIDAGDEAMPVAHLDRRPSRRGWIVLAAAAATVAVVAGVAYAFTLPDEIRTVDTAPTFSTVPTPSVTPSSTEPSPTTTAPAPTTAPPSTFLAPDELPSIAVSYRALSPVADVDRLTTVSLASPDQAGRPAAIGDLGVAMVGRRSVTVVAWDGTTREVAIDVASLRSPLYGPGDVLYGLDAEQGIVAIALSGDRSGQVLASAQLPAGPIAEHAAATSNSLAHGPDGVIDAAVTGDGPVLLGYVDVAGEPVAWSVGPLGAIGVQRAADAGLPGDARLVIRNGDRYVESTIERGPDWVEPDSLPNPGRGPGSTVVYPATLGSSEFRDGSVAPASAVMTLGPNGEAFWSTIDPAFEFVASSPWGVLVKRIEPDTQSITWATLDLRPITDPATLDAESTGVGVPCSDGSRCFTIAVAPDGALVTYRPDTGVVTLVRDAILIGAPAVDGGYIAGVGPDDTVYLVTSPLDGTAEEGNDVVAVSMAADRPGTIVQRWAHAIGMSGDSELVATPEGMVIVGCCGMDTVRPEPGAAVEFPWLDRTGAEVTLDEPAVRFDTVGEIVTVGDAWWGLVIRESEGDRGMPPIEATTDGGFVGVFADVGGSDNVTVVRGWPDGTHTQVVMAGHPEFLTPDGRLGYARDGEYVVVDPFAR